MPLSADWSAEDQTVPPSIFRRFARQNDSPLLLQVYRFLMRLLQLHVLFFSHQTTRLMNSSTHLVQRLDSAFFYIATVYGVDQRFSKCQRVPKKKISYLPDCKVTFLIHAVIYSKVINVMLLMSNNI